MKKRILLHIRNKRFRQHHSPSGRSLLRTVTDLLLLFLGGSAFAQSPCDSVAISYTVSNPSCYGSATGSIDITMTGGLSPYTYAWSNGTVTEDAAGLPAGTYGVLVSDQNGCLNSLQVTLMQPAALTDAPVIQDVLCNGNSNGYVISNVSGGTQPYNYFWSNGAQLPNGVNLAAGTYIMTVADYNGCVLKDTFLITQPLPLALSLFSPEPVPGYNVSTYLGSDGFIDATVSGGVSPYMYTWSNGSAVQDPSGLMAGNYAVTVTDSNGCIIHGAISLNQPLMIEMPSGFTPNGDGNNDNFVVHGAEEYPDNVLTVFNRWGNIVYQKQSYTNQWNGYNNKGSELPDGTYFAIMEIRSKELVLKGYVELKRH